MAGEEKSASWRGARGGPWLPAPTRQAPGGSAAPSARGRVTPRLAAAHLHRGHRHAGAGALVLALARDPGAQAGQLLAQRAHLRGRAGHARAGRGAAGGEQAAHTCPLSLLLHAAAGYGARCCCSMLQQATALAAAAACCPAPTLPCPAAAAETTLHQVGRAGQELPRCPAACSSAPCARGSTRRGRPRRRRRGPSRAPGPSPPVVAGK